MTTDGFEWSPLIGASEADGIAQQDHGWSRGWSWCFATTIICAMLYWTYYGLGTGASAHAAYDAARADALDAELAALGAVTPSDESIQRLIADQPQSVRAARVMFEDWCAACHRHDGGGTAFGPNLTDDAWIHVGRPRDLISIIANGVPGREMPAWSDRVREPQIILLASYVASMRDTRPPHARAAEGTLIPGW